MMERLSLKNRRGQVQSIAPAILALVFAAVVLVFGLVMSQEIRDTQVGTTSNSVTNESVTVGANSVGTIASYNTQRGFSAWNATAIINSSAPGFQNNTLVEGTDYTIFAANGSFYNTTNLVATSVLVTYTFTDGGEAYIAGNKTTFGLGTFADFWEIIVLAIVITVVIGLLLVVFGGRRQR